MTRSHFGTFLILLAVIGPAVTLYIARHRATQGTAESATDFSELLYDPVDATEQTIRFYQARVARDPIDAQSHNKLAAAYMQRARETGDVSYLERAGKLLEQSLDILPEDMNDPAAALSAAVSYSTHQFEAARAWAQKAIALKPQDGYAYGQLGDACVELGDYEHAAAAYERMIRLRAGLYSYSRWSHFKDLTGDTDGAIRAMRDAIEAGRQSPRTSRENLAWCQAQLGALYFNTGDLTQAEAHYAAALQTWPAYRLALAGLANVRAAQAKSAEAISLYHQAVASIPEPDYIAALGDLYANTGQPEEAQKHYDLVVYIGTLAKLNRTIYNRQLAQFYLDHNRNLAEALNLAQQELAVRKDIYGYDTLAWALYKNGRYKEALAASRKALQLGTNDARLHYHAGMIQAKLGHHQEAAAALERALDINPYFHPRQAEEARAALNKLGVMETVKN
jgi:tetratricopeptide (TPR) repeat protein